MATRSNDLSALFAAIVASKAEQRQRISERTALSDGVGGDFGSPAPRAPSAKDLAYSVMRMPEGPSSLDARGISKNQAKKSFGSALVDGAKPILSGGQWALDMLSRPLNFTEGFVDEAMNDRSNKNPLQAGWEGFTKGASGTGQGFGADIIRREDERNGVDTKGKGLAYGASGMAMDVILDPLTYASLGTVPATKILGRGVLSGLKALGLKAPSVVKNAGKLETVSAGERAAADLANTGTTSVGPNAAKELSQKTRESYAAKIAPAGEITQLPNQPQTRFSVGADGTTTDAAGAATKGKNASQLEAMMRLGQLQKALSNVRPYKYGKNSVVRRLAEDDPNLPLPMHSAPDPLEQAIYNRRVGGYRSAVIRRDKAMANYQAAVENAGKKTLPAIPREQARDIARRAAIAGKEVDPKNQIVRAHLAAGKKPQEIADILDAQASQEGRKLSIPLFVKGSNGRYRIGMEVNTDAFENLLHTGKVAKPIPLTAKGDVRQATRTVREVDANGIPTGKFTEVPVEGKTTGSLYYTAGTGKKRQAFKATEQHSAFLADSESIAEDLTRLHMIDPDSGKVVPLGDFLAKYNITASTLQAGNAETIASKLSGASNMRRVNPNFGGKVREPKFSGDLVEPTPPAIRHTPFNRDELRQWVNENASDLSPQTLAWILNGKGKSATRTPEAIRARAKQIADQLSGTGPYAALDDVLEAVASGDMPTSQLDEIMGILNVKSVDEIRPAVEGLTKRMTAKEEIASRATAKIEQAETEIDNATAQARPTDQLIEDINHSNEVAAADAKLTEGLDGFQRAAVDDITRDVIQYQHYRPQNKEAFPYVTNKGVPRTHKTPGKGEGVHKNTFNEGAQLRAASLTISRVGKDWEKLKIAAKKAGEQPPNRAEYMYENALPMLKAVEAKLRSQNIPVVLGSKASGIPMGLSDILDTLPPEFVKKYVFTFTKALDPTQIMRIGEILVQYGSKKVDAQVAADAVVQHLVSPRHSTGLAANARETGQLSWSNFSKYINSQDGRESIAQEVAKVFMQATPRIVDVANMRATELSLKIGEHAQAVSDAVIAQAAKVLADPWAPVGQKTIAIADAEAVVKPAAKTANKQKGVAQSPVGGDELAKQVVAQKINSLDGALIAKATAANARKMNVARSGEDIMRVNMDGMKDAHTFVKQIAEEEGKHLVYDLGANVEMAFMYRLGRYMFGHIGNNDLRGLLLNRVNLASTTSKHVGVQLGNIAQKYPKSDINAAFLALQEGRPMESDVYRDVAKVFGDIFGPEPDSAGRYVNLFTSSGVTPNDINYHGKKFGLLDSMMFPPNATPEEMANAFRNWDLGGRDVLEALNRLHAATQNAAVLRAIGADLSERFGVVRPPVGSTEKWVKVKNSNSKSLIARLIDTDRYYPEHIAQQMHVLDETLKTLHNPLATSKVARYYDGTLSALKAGWTIYRPGHHIRNAIGDGFFNYLDGVKVRHHHNALSVLHVGRGNYQGWDSVMALQSVGIAPDATKIVTRNKHMNIELTAQQAHKLMYQTGNLPDYRILEDIAFGGETEDIASKLRRLSPLKGKARNVASTVSEVRDHYFRAAHWLKAFEDVKVPANIKRQGENATLKYMADMASMRVRKWHPDGSDLTMFEKKLMRRTILFYSWMRKAIPLVVQSTFLRPGKVMLYPKAMYNMAESMGIDLESYSNPFPSDQLFPSWLADSTQGPTFLDNGKYYGIRPGIPTADIMDQYFKSPKGLGQTLLGSTTPAFKVPLEILMGRDLRTGLEIRDKTDYVDRQIPGISNIASLTGRSPSSGFTQLTQAAQTKQDYNANASSASPESALNLLTGAGVMDMSKPNYIKSAQLEQKYRARDLYRKLQQGG